METFYWYKGYGVRYYQALGTTSVEEHGVVVKMFNGLGMIKGKAEAEKWVDENGIHKTN